MGIDHNNIDKILCEAIEIGSEEERCAYLNKVCGNDTQLRREAERLVVNHFEAGDFLEKPAMMPDVIVEQPVTESVPVNLPLGTIVGPYKLREQIAEGGMGVVYVAEQTAPIARKVALKVIKPGMDTRQVIARFEAERQALAMMDHPNIAKVLDAGSTDAGRPYFVMDLVRGLPITEYCDKHRLTPQERLDLFVTVCDAVQHAHQKGVIHRDIKPSNVLVTRNGDRAVPKVIDFGVAKAINQRLTERTVYTEFNQLIGTPLYMSPEQAELSELDVDTRSDVYSLGILLYELLTGSTPFDQEKLSSVGYDQLRRIIKEHEPQRPSEHISTLAAERLSTISDQRGSDPKKLSHTVRGELDWIVMKAIDKDRRRRYESASALAADVKRFLDGDAVEACPPSVGYRLSKLARRNKTAIVTGSVVFAALLLGIAGTSWQAWRATNALATAESNLQLASTERERALENFRHARDTIDQYLSAVDENSLLQNPEMHPLRRELVELAAKYYQRFIDNRKNDPELQADLAAAYERTGEISSKLGHSDEARESYEQALRIRERLQAEDPENAELQHDLAGGLANMASVQPTFDEAHAYFQRAIAIAQPLVKPAHRMRLGDIYLSLGKLQTRQSNEKGDAEHREEAVAAFKKAKTIYQELMEASPDDMEFQTAVAAAYNHEGMGYLLMENEAEAKSSFRSSLQIYEKLAREAPDDPDLRKALAVAYYNVDEHRRALEITSRLVEENPVDSGDQLFLASIHIQVAELQSGAENRNQAVASHQAAVEIIQNLAEKYPEHSRYRGRLALYYNLLGQAQRKAGRLQEAIHSHEMAIQLAERFAPGGKGLLADAYFNLSRAQRGMGNFEEAIATLQLCLPIGQELVENSSNQFQHRNAHSRHYDHFGNLQRDVGQLEEAIRSYQTALEILERPFVERDPPDAPPAQITAARYALASYHQAIGKCLEELGRHDEAAEAYQRSEKIAPLEDD